MSEERIGSLQLPEKYGLTLPQHEALSRVLLWTKDFFDNIPQGTHIGGHGFDKTMRQAGMAAYLSFKEGHPVFLPSLTAMIMDVGRTQSLDSRSRNYQHGELSREMARPLLDSLDILSPEDRELVENAVEDHPKLNENVRRNYMVEIAMDADRLDCLGMLGPLRAASWRPNIPIILPEETETTSGDTLIQTMWQDMAIRHMEWVGMLWTEAAREIARPRVERYSRYLEDLKNETSFMYQAYQNLNLPLVS